MFNSLNKVSDKAFSFCFQKYRQQLSCVQHTFSNASFYPEILTTDLGKTLKLNSMNKTFHINIFLKSHRGDDCTLCALNTFTTPDIALVCITGSSCTKAKFHTELLHRSGRNTKHTKFQKRIHIPLVFRECWLIMEFSYM